MKISIPNLHQANWKRIAFVIGISIQITGELIGKRVPLTFEKRSKNPNVRRESLHEQSKETFGSTIGRISSRVIHLTNCSSLQDSLSSREKRARLIPPSSSECSGRQLKAILASNRHRRRSITVDTLHSKHVYLVRQPSPRHHCDHHALKSLPQRIGFSLWPTSFV